MFELSGIQASEHGVPRRGYVLSTAVEGIARSGRTIVSELSSAFALCGKPNNSFEFGSDDAGLERTAWHAFSIWLLWRIYSPETQDTSLLSSQIWYNGGPIEGDELAFWSQLDDLLDRHLREVANKSGIRELLPYVLESHGPGSRLSVRRDPSTWAARRKKKASGVFYTPPDVADFMAYDAVQSCEQTPVVLDPAAGTGVFLRSTLKVLCAADTSKNTFQLARGNIFGCDIDPLALDGAATVVMSDVMQDALYVMDTPREAWWAIRSNFRQCDALLIDPVSTPTTRGRISLQELFPNVVDGFDLVIGNPPYADIGKRSDMPELASIFKTIEACPRSTADLYPVFIEQMVRLAKPNAAGGLVVPLSIACNSGPQFRACRKFISATSGSWKFAFFDRQPHALFGEDVKTRNAIVFRLPDPDANTVSTGPLRKWRGNDRQEMLASIEYTPISNDITSGIPKLHGHRQSDAWSKLAHETYRLAHTVSSMGRSTLDEVPNSPSSDVFVAPTAYNFLGVARPCRLPVRSGETLSANPVLRVSCIDEEAASVVYAVLSGNFAFWWWHVNGDGFHVSQSTLRNLSIGRIANDSFVREKLARLGESVWAYSSERPVRSLNRGRVSYAFSASGAVELRRMIDRVVLGALGLPPSLEAVLHEFKETITAARLFEPASQTSEGKSRHDRKGVERDKRKKPTYQRGVA